MKQILASLQRVGGALMLPIAVLPIAGLLLRLGQPDLLDFPSMAAAGDAIFSDLGLLFAIGVAVGLARENHGAAGLASVVGYLVTTKGAQVLISVPPDAVADVAGHARELAVAAYKAHELGKLSIPVGIISGLIAGMLYNRFSGIRLPSYLAFFGGRRFVPIASGFVGLLLAAVFGSQWQRLEAGMDALSHSVLNAGALGMFAYGVLNRVLIVTGLHHIINNIAWFLLGDYNGTTGDLKRFFAGDPSAGVFMAGFFPVMMFGLPAACLAMYHAAPPERRKAVAGLLLSIALTSSLTGVTEPIEFTFMFLAPMLYAVHALLTGVAFVIMNALHVRLGFGFSAGLFDYILNFNKATRPLLLLPVGLLYFGLYYGLFRFAIVRFNLQTPGRDEDTTVSEADARSGGVAGPAWAGARVGLVGGPGAVGAGVGLVGGSGAVGAGAGLVGGSGAGAGAGLVGGSGAGAGAGLVGGPGAGAGAGLVGGSGPGAGAGAVGGVWASGAPPLDEPGAYIAALGGAANIVTLDACTTRLRLVVADQAVVNAAALKRLGARGLVKPSANALQVVIGTNADQIAGEIKAALRASVAAVPGGATTAGAPAASDAASASATPATAPPSVTALATQTIISLIAALGGRSNIKTVESASTRLRVNVASTASVDESAIIALGMRGVAVPNPNWVHVIVGPAAPEAGITLRQLLVSTWGDCC